MFVGRRMKRDLVTVPPGATLEEAARLLKGNRIHHLPVVEGKRLLGIVTDTDLRNATLRGAAEEGGGAPRTVGEVMTRDVVTLSPDDTIDDAMLILSRQRFGALPVVDGERLVGIVAKADILAAVLETLDIEGVGVRLEVILPRDMGEVTRLSATLRELPVEVRSLVLAPHGKDRYAAFVRVATIDVPGVRERLRGKGFTVAELSDFYEPG
jgi:acetoin utilization protein AcuB